MLDSGEPLTAVFAGNDLLALGLHLRRPDDVSMIGFNHMPFADQFTPPLTTIRYSYYDMGKSAGEMLMGQISGPNPYLPSQITDPQNAKHQQVPVSL